MTYKIEFDFTTVRGNNFRGKHGTTEMVVDGELSKEEIEEYKTDEELRGAMIKRYWLNGVKRYCTKLLHCAWVQKLYNETN